MSVHHARRARLGDAWEVRYRVAGRQVSRRFDTRDQALDFDKKQQEERDLRRRIGRARRFDDATATRARFL